MKPLWVLTLIIAAAAVASLIFLGDGVQATEADETNSIGICCAWNAELADGDLTYKVSGGDDAARAVVRAAVEQLEVVGITFTEITDSTKPDAAFKFKRGGGQIQGQARRKFDDAGFIKSVDISISGRAFGDPNNADIIGRIAKHEGIHALGPGHANFDGDLMSTTVGAGISEISACDIDAVEAANAWFFAGGSVPAAPTVDHVHCGAVSPPPPPPGDLETILVQSITCAVSGNRLLYTITVVDEDANLVEGATVSGTREDPRGRTFRFEGDTNASGQITFRAGRPARGDHVITVENVEEPGFEFDPALGESSKTCTV